MEKWASGGGYDPKDYGPVYRPVVSFLALLAAVLAYFSLIASLAGLANYTGDWAGPLVVSRKLEIYVDVAWTYFVPVVLLLVVSTVIMFGCLIALVQYPPLRTKPPRAAAETTESD